LEREHVQRFLDDADRPTVSLRILADGAWVHLGNVEAGGAEDRPLLHPNQRLGERVRLLGRRPQEEVRQLLGRLRPDARQTVELVDQPSDRLGRYLGKHRWSPPWRIIPELVPIASADARPYNTVPYASVRHAQPTSRRHYRSGRGDSRRAGRGVDL